MKLDDPMPKPPVIPGPAPKILLIRAPYYGGIVDGMTSAAKQVLEAAHASVESIEVAGAYELPQALRLCVKAPQKYDGFIALGCVVRGETDHYEFICAATMDGLMNVALQHALCLGTAVLTVDNLMQAQVRSHETGHNKGAEAAIACLKQIVIARQMASA
jgi:6,7-dimethyl-8-ribityllumazine synthase